MLSHQVLNKRKIANLTCAVIVRCLKYEAAEHLDYMFGWDYATTPP